jgi:hypothetical protein
MIQWTCRSYKRLWLAAAAAHWALHPLGGRAGEFCMGSCLRHQAGCCQHCPALQACLAPSAVTCWLSSATQWSQCHLMYSKFALSVSARHHHCSCCKCCGPLMVTAMIASVCLVPPCLHTPSTCHQADASHLFCSEHPAVPAAPATCLRSVVLCERSRRPA